MLEFAAFHFFWMIDIHANTPHTMISNTLKTASLSATAAMYRTSLLQTRVILEIVRVLLKVKVKMKVKVRVKVIPKPIVTKLGNCLHPDPQVAQDKKS